MSLAKSYNRSTFGRWLVSPPGRVFRLVAGSGFALAGVVYWVRRLGRQRWSGAYSRCQPADSTSAGSAQPWVGRSEGPPVAWREPPLRGEPVAFDTRAAAKDW